MKKRDKNMNILAVIPARSGSKRIPNKNMRKLGNKPLLAYMIESAKKAQLIDKLVLSTDDDELSKVGLSLGVEVPMKRPDHLSSDNTPLISVIKYMYDFFKKNGFHFNAVLSLQPTCPFISAGTIDKVISMWKETGCESVTTIAEITRGHPYISKRLNGDNTIENFCIIPDNTVIGPSHTRKKAYYLTGGIYLRDRSLLESDVSGGHCLGKDSRAVLLNEIEAIDINTEIDFKFAEFLQIEGIIE